MSNASMSYLRLTTGDMDCKASTQWLWNPHAPQTGFGDSLLHGAVSPDSVHELVDGRKLPHGSLAHSNRHLHDVETSGQYACANASAIR